MPRSGILHRLEGSARAHDPRAPRIVSHTLSGDITAPLHARTPRRESPLAGGVAGPRRGGRLRPPRRRVHRRDRAALGRQVVLRARAGGLRRNAHGALPLSPGHAVPRARTGGGERARPRDELRARGARRGGADARPRLRRSAHAPGLALPRELRRARRRADLSPRALPAVLLVAGRRVRLRAPDALVLAPLARLDDAGGRRRRGRTALQGDAPDPLVCRPGRGTPERAARSLALALGRARGRRRARARALRRVTPGAARRSHPAVDRPAPQARDAGAPLGGADELRALLDARLGVPRLLDADAAPPDAGTAAPARAGAAAARARPDDLRGPAAPPRDVRRRQHRRLRLLLDRRAGAGAGPARARRRARALGTPRHARVPLLLPALPPPDPRSVHRARGLPRLLRTRRSGDQCAAPLAGGGLARGDGRGALAGGPEARAGGTMRPMRMPSVAAILAGLACAGASACGGGEGTAGGAPSILLVVVDTLRADHLGAYG